MKTIWVHSETIVADCQTSDLLTSYTKKELNDAANIAVIAVVSAYAAADYVVAVAVVADDYVAENTRHTLYADYVAECEVSDRDAKRSKNLQPQRE